MLEALLEGATAHDPSKRPSMREFADELAWWGEPQVVTRPDLSGYREEIERLRQATTLVRQETDEERLERLYNEALNRVHEQLSTHLMDAMESVGLRVVGNSPRMPDGLPPGKNYGGAFSWPCWEVGTLSSPWLAAGVGVVHRVHPVTDLADLKVSLVLAAMTPDSQHNYLEFLEGFKPGSLNLDRVIERIKNAIDRQLPDVIADFLSRCKTAGVPGEAYSTRLWK